MRRRDRSQRPDVRVLRLDDFVALTETWQVTHPNHGRPVEWIRATVPAGADVFAYSLGPDMAGVAALFVLPTKTKWRQYRMDVTAGQWDALRKPSRAQTDSALYELLRRVSVEPMTDAQQAEWAAVRWSDAHDGDA